MIWQEQWTALSARIHAFLESCTVFYESAKAVGADYSGNISSYLLPASTSIIDEMRTFASAHSTDLPPRASDALSRFFTTWDRRSGAGDSGFPRLQVMIAALGSIRSELDYLMRDYEALGIRRIERALIHLRRLIVVDDEVSAKWCRAFEAGETECEALGAVHLLQHGIWAFKASATGERTDLVLGQPLDLSEEHRRASDVMVLTEWKRVVQPTEVDRLADRGVKQARRYGGGILAGFELSTTRYVILVSSETVRTPDVLLDGDHRYRFFNIAVSPEPPSRAKA